MRRLAGIALLALGLAAQAQVFTCIRAEAPGGGFTVTCTPPAAPPVVTKPVEPPPPPPPAEPAGEVSPRFRELVALRDPRLELSDIVWRLARAPTPAELAYARAQGVPGAEPVSRPPPAGNGPTFDPWTHRDLTGTSGNVLRLQGFYGHRETFQLREPAGRRLQITAFRVNSVFGACEDLEISAQGKTERGRGSDAFAKLDLVSTGDDPVTVTLLCAGGAGVQLN